MFKSKKVTVQAPVLSAKTMIEEATGVVDNALVMFKVAVQEIEKANEMLAQSKAMSEEKVVALQQELASTHQTKANAEASIQANLALKEKLSQFMQ